MEDNLTDALIMAGAILIFVFALSLSMSSFTKMRTQIDQIIEYDSDLDLVTDNSGNLLNYHTSDSDVRLVGIETVVSSMYRVTKENYVVYIAGLNNAGIHSGNEVSNVSFTTINNIESEYSNRSYTRQTYKGAEIIGESDKIIEISINGLNSNIDAVLGKDESIDNKKLYNKLKDKKFAEYLGVYQEATNEGVDEVNKTTYRVITYIIQP